VLLERHKITVLMSVYNGGSFLGPAIESILGQSHADFEFIVIDDGSSDGSADTIASYRDRRLRVIRHPENAGLAARLNQGFAVASGRYIARMDADDISMPERLERQITFMQAHPYVGACGTWIEVTGGGVTQRWEYPVSHRAIHARLLFDCAMAHPTVMFDRLRLQKARLSYDSSYPCAQDYDLWCRAVEDLSLANIPEVLLIRHLHADQVGRRDANAQQRWAATIRRRQLERLGIKLTDQHGALHEAISTWSWPKTEVFLHDAEAWLCRLLEANRSHAVYPEPEFSAVVGERWMAICRSMEPKLGRRFWNSPLSGTLELGWAENLRGRAWRGLAMLGL
jgi:glycosyltransferase involved in cell wall biosynthesis